jgi:ABC-type branched-subunit amino acid transport system substrate-binding protein
MSTYARAVLGCLALAVAGVQAAHAQAPRGTKGQPAEIVVGHVAGYTGPVMSDAVELGQGAKIFFDAVNEKGGIDGRKLRILAVDDQFNPANTVKFVGEMKGKVAALLPLVGSANTAALVKADVLPVPTVGTIPSTEIVRGWQNPNLFHIRASDRQQTERILEHLITVGISKIATFVPNNPFGDQSTKQVEAYLTGRGLKLDANGVYILAGGKPDLKPGLDAFKGKQPQAIVMFGPPKFIADAVDALKGSGQTGQLYALSYADSRMIVKIAGKERAHGVVISQVMPSLRSKQLPIVKAFRSDFAQYAQKDWAMTHFTIEGYVAARLIVEAIRRTKDASPEGVRRGLEQLREYDLGGYTINFSAGNHHGSSFVDLSMIIGAGDLIY